ncbi:MAG: 50S ribosomal protein L35 [Ferrimicrobium sp.]|uniref:50S ribosomal protein L35 n=1 Tax=Ferrimicrobium sp. TaxID=2926050 RepID=UPI0026240447|nr:50S ribosomal protein L35 [Ferrimicrobium sp.]
MPKMKTDKGAKARFKVTGTGKLRRQHAFTSHLLEKKSSRRMRHLHQSVEVSSGDARRVKKLLGR